MSLKLSTLFVFVLVFALALTACGTKPQDICGDAGVASYDGTKTVCNSAPAVEATQQVVSTSQSDPTAQAAAPEMQSFVPYEPEGGVPYSGSEWNADVAPDEIEVLTAGPATIAGVSLPGGEKRGSVIIMLPGTKVVSYTITGLIPGANWHASYRPLKVDEATWRALAADRVAAMKLAPNCSLGTGCGPVDVLVVSSAGVVAQWTVP